MVVDMEVDKLANKVAGMVDLWWIWRMKIAATGIKRFSLDRTEPVNTFARIPKKCYAIPTSAVVDKINLTKCTRVPRTPFFLLT